MIDKESIIVIDSWHSPDIIKENIVID